MAYATNTELKARLNKTGSEDDTTITALLEASTVAIDRFCHRPDGFLSDTLASARIYSGSGQPVQAIDECTEITLVAVKDSPTDTAYTSWVAADWIAFGGDPNNPDFQPTSKGMPYTGIMCSAAGDYSTFTSGRYVSLKGFAHTERTRRSVPTVQVTAKWGYSATVPAQIREACIMQAARWYKRGQAAYSDTLAMPDTGQLMFRKVLDPDIQHILEQGRFVRPTIG